MIRVEGLSHDYEGKGRYAVKDVGFSVGRGEIFGFLGPSGAGKSTVQNILVGLVPLQTGAASLAGEDVRRLKPRFFEKVGYSFERPNLFSKLTGYENLKYFAGLFRTPTLDPMVPLARLGLEASAHKRVERWSKGMKQRLLFARAILNRPEILFLDEPESGLDPSTALVVKEMIREERARGAAILLTTHSMYVADELCDQVAFLHEGSIVERGTPRELKLRFGSRSATAETREAGGIASRDFDLDDEKARSELAELVRSGAIETLHTREATLESVFIRLTGKALSS